MEKEIYKNIPGYDGVYQVSNFGNVRSFKNGRHGLKTTPKILKQSKDTQGYLKVMFSYNNKVINAKIHKLVAMAFLDHIPDGYNMTVNHIDKNHLNNKLDNLELLPFKEHIIKDRFGNGRGYSFIKNRNKWRAEITVNYKTIFLGEFINKQDAINLYNKAINNIHLYYGDNNEFRNKLKYGIQ
jgi:hypothetical protein